MKFSPKAEDSVLLHSGEVEQSPGVYTVVYGE